MIDETDILERDTTLASHDVHSSRTLSTETTSKGKVLGLDGDPLSMDGSQVGVLEEADEVGLGGFLKGHDYDRQPTLATTPPVLKRKYDTHQRWTETSSRSTTTTTISSRTWPTATTSNIP